MSWDILERIFGLVFVVPLLPDHLRLRHLERHGTRTRARVGEERTRFSLLARGLELSYALTFTAADGSNVTATLKPEGKLETAWVDIVYDPERPKDLCLASELPPGTLVLKGAAVLAVLFALVPITELSALAARA
ncbi:hypothetical protein ACFY4C_26170 [Actinomadura viridis]|uniref:hypothetical protein n=1 Tax=Actinomadura viridis TaxID=58110 RepID=UPI0036A1E964